MKILVVDDNAHDLDATVFFLEKNEFTDIHTASTGRECIDKAIELKPDVIILDVVLPDMKGYGICKAIKENKELSCTVILLTGEFLENEPEKVIKAGPDYFLAKTGAYKQLLKILEKL